MARDLAVALKILVDLDSARRELQLLRQNLNEVSQSSHDLSNASDLRQSTQHIEQQRQSLNQLDQSIGNATRSNAEFGQSIRNLTPQFVAATAAATGFAAIAIDTINKSAELKQQAYISGLDVEQFQYYAEGAKRLGVSQEELANIFKDTRDKIGDFNIAEAGGMTDFFEKVAPAVGLTIENFKKLNGAQALELYVKSLREANVEENDAVFMLEALASESLRLLPLLENNAEGFKKYGDQAQRAGAILSRDFVEESIVVRDSMLDLKNKAIGLSNTMVENALPAIKFLTENLGLLAQAGMIVASVYVAKLAPSMLTSINTTIAELTTKGQALFMSRNRATALLAEATAQQLATAAQVRAAQSALAVAMGTQAQATAQARLSAARAADTAATLVQTRAQELLNATMARTSLVSGALVASLGGPLGLAVLAGGVATSFLLLKDNSQQATEGLNVHGESVEELTARYVELSNRQQKAVLNQVNSELEKLSLQFRVASSDLSSFTEGLSISDEKLVSLKKLNSQFSQGRIDANAYYDAIEALNILSEDELSILNSLINSYTSSKTALNAKRTEVDAYNKASEGASNASKDFSKNLDTLGSSAAGAKKQIQFLSKEYNDYMDQLNKDTLNSQITFAYMQKGLSEEEAKARAELYALKNSNPKANQTYFVTDDEASKLKAKLNAEEKVADLAEKRRKEEQEITKEREKQYAGDKRLVALVGSTGTSTGNHLDIRYDRSYSSGAVSAAHLARFELGGKTLNAKNAISKYGYRVHPTKKTTHLHRGYDFPAPAGTEVTTSYPIKDVKTWWDKNGGGYTSTVIFEDGVKVNLLHQIPSMKSKIKGGTSKGKNASEQSVDAYNIFTTQQEEQQRFLEEQEKKRISIDLKFATEPEKLKYEYDEIVKQINSAGYKPDIQKKRLAQAEQDYQDKLSKRPEVLKRVQDTVASLETDFLRASNQNLTADLKNIETKWQPLKDDLAQLMLSEKNPIQAKEFEDLMIKVNVVIDQEKLTLEFNDAMQQLDELQSLRSQRQNNLKLQFESGQISHPQFAQGLQNIDSELLPQMQMLSEQALLLAQRLGDAFAVEKVNTFILGLNQTDENLKKFLPTADQLNERIAGGLADAFMAFADGAQSASDAFREFASSFLREIAQMILKQMIFNAISKIGGKDSGGIGGLIATGIGKAFGGYSSGGYTGAGGKYQPAGIVHKDEFVIRKESTNQIGAKAFLSDFNQYGMLALNKFKGYSNGGLVGASTLSVPEIQTPKLNEPVSQIAESTRFNANQNFYLVDDPARILDTLKSNQAQENIVIMMSRDPSKFKSALKID